MSAKKLNDVDPYVLLGLEIEAEQADIRKAYRKKALKCHPDKNPDNPKASELFHELSKALEILTDETARAAYDKAKKATEPLIKQHKHHASQPYTTERKSYKDAQQSDRLREYYKLLEENQRQTQCLIQQRWLQMQQHLLEMQNLQLTFADRQQKKAQHYNLLEENHRQTLCLIQQQQHRLHMQNLQHIFADSQQNVAQQAEKRK